MAAFLHICATLRYGRLSLRERALFRGAKGDKPVGAAYRHCVIVKLLLPVFVLTHHLVIVLVV